MLCVHQENEVEGRLEDLFKNDYSEHNAMLKELDASLETGKPLRKKVIVGFNVRVTLADPRLNPQGFTFEEMHNDSDFHALMQLRMQAWKLSAMKFDWEMGLPDEWVISPYVANVHEDSLVGGKVIYPGGPEVPATSPHFNTEDGFERFMDFPFESIPKSGYMVKMKNVWYDWKEKEAKGWEYLGRPVKIGKFTQGTDGPFTVFSNTFGPEKPCFMMMDEPEKFHQVMDRFTTYIIQRIQDAHKDAQCPLYPNGFGYADDMIALLQTSTFEEFVLPYHRRMVEAFETKGLSNSIHLCGNASRHFKLLKDELNVKSFDTGFPINFDTLRDELGNDVHISGGPKVSFFMEDSEALKNETIRIVQSKTATEGLFTLKEGNNLPPNVSDENLKVFYDTAVKTMLQNNA